MIIGISAPLRQTFPFVFLFVNNDCSDAKNDDDDVVFALQC